MKDAQITLEVVRQHLMALSEDEIPSLIKDYAKLQVACILCGNYDLKIARQNYFMDNQDQVSVPHINANYVLIISGNYV